MKKLAVFWGSVCGLLLAAFFCSLPVSATDITTIVELTPAQTLALYGDTISATYYDGGSYHDCDFQFLGYERGIINSSETNNLSSYGYTSSQIQSLFDSQTWLYYGVPASDTPDIVGESNPYQLRLEASVNIENIAYFRQIVCSYVANTGQGSNFPWKSAYYVASFTSYATPNVVSYGVALETSTNETYSNVYFTPRPPIDAVNTWQQTRASFCDVYLQNLVDGQEQTFSYSGMVFRCAKIPPVGVYLNDSNVADPFIDHYRIIAISCPRITDGYNLPDLPEPEPNYGEQLDDLISGQTQISANLAAILAKLDLIYQKNYSVNVNLDSSSIVSGIVDGIKGLFVPTQSDLLNFRLNMSTLVSDTFAPFEAAQTLRDAALNRITSASPTATIDLPLLDLRPTVDFHIPAETFTEQGYQVVDNKVKVPLKPRENEWGTFYELVAWGIDIICTLAFVNMLLNKFNGLIVGKKVVELEDDY